MVYILMALFGGGTADWEDIGATYYDWDMFYMKRGNKYDR